MRRITTVIALLVVTAALGACREEEQGRPLTFDKGVYGGPADEALGEDDLNALRQRATQQHF